MAMKSLGTALRVLSAFLDNRSDHGVTDLAVRLGLPKSQVSKILSTFREQGFLTQHPDTRRYSVGLRTFALGTRFVNFNRLAREAVLIMRSLVERSGHSTRLSVMDRDQVIYILGIEGPLFLDTGWRSGTILPLHATSAGRVFLAFADDARVDLLLDTQGLEAVTAHTITDRRILKRKLADVRRLGYAVSRDESTLGLSTIGAPVFDAGQKVTGVLGLAFPSHVVARGEEPRFAAMLHDAARTLSLRLGCPVYPFGNGSPQREDRSDAPAVETPTLRSVGRR